MSNSSFAGDVTESIMLFGTGHQYNYQLTEQGREAVRELRSQHQAQADAISQAVAKIHTLLPGYTQHPLSLAAKVDLILSEQQAPTRASDIPKLAEDLGWQVSPDEVSRAVGFLVGLGLISTS